MFSKSYLLATTASLLTTTVVAMSASGAMAGDKNYAGVSLGSWGGVTAFGVNAKYGIAENISVRPFVQFASQSGFGYTATLALYGATATYDFKLPNTEFTPYAGLGLAAATISASGGGYGGTASSGGNIYFEGGTDYAISDSIVLNANYRATSGNGGIFTIGAGYNF